MSATAWRRLETMPRAFGGPAGHGIIRCHADDFQVDEILAFEPTGAGEHIFLQLRKRETNTLWLARQIARFAGVPNQDVSYAGLKDRRAVTSQWFSVRLAGRPEPDWHGLESDQIQLMWVARHQRKLRTGALRGNRFQLRIRELSADLDMLNQRLQQIRLSGIPNYFGEQRFGVDYANLAQAEALFSRKLGRVERKLRGLLISAARSQLFNEVLTARIDRGDWDRPVAGDYFKLDGSRAGFPVESLDPTIKERCEALDIHPSGPLWGRGRPLVSGEILQLEEGLLAPYDIFRTGLEHVGLEQERRSLRIKVTDLDWRYPDHSSLLLEFSLPAGSYATVLLRELLQISQASVSRVVE